MRSSGCLPSRKARWRVLATALAFSFLVVRPLEERSRLLLSRIQPGGVGQRRRQGGGGVPLPEEGGDADRLAGQAVRHRPRHRHRAAVGDLQRREAGGRIQRYEIVLPVAGSYTQLRDFLKRATAEIPVLSVDQMSVKRESRNDSALQAELRLTLHMVQP